MSWQDDNDPAAWTRELRDRYYSALHKVQSAFALQVTRLGVTDGSSPAHPKHLLVGNSSALSSHAALLRLLVKKGVCSQAEYVEELVRAAEDEAEYIVADTRKKLNLPATVSFA